MLADFLAKMKKNKPQVMEEMKEEEPEGDAPAWEFKR